MPAGRVLSEPAVCEVYGKGEEDAQQSAGQNIRGVVHEEKYAGEGDRSGQKQCGPGFLMPQEKHSGRREAGGCVAGGKGEGIRPGNEQRNIGERVTRTRPADQVFQAEFSRDKGEKHREKDQQAGGARFLKAQQNDGGDDPDRAGLAEIGDDRKECIGEGIMQTVLHKFHDGGIKAGNAR